MGSHVCGPAARMMAAPLSASRGRRSACPERWFGQPVPQLVTYRYIWFADASMGSHVCACGCEDDGGAAACCPRLVICLSRKVVRSASAASAGTSVHLVRGCINGFACVRSRGCEGDGRAAICRLRSVICLPRKVVRSASAASAGTSAHLARERINGFAAGTMAAPLSAACGRRADQGSPAGAASTAALPHRAGGSRECIGRSACFSQAFGHSPARQRHRPSAPIASIGGAISSRHRRSAASAVDAANASAVARRSRRQLGQTRAAATPAAVPAGPKPAESHERIGHRVNGCDP
jgi:hypothetical protein